MKRTIISTVIVLMTLSAQARVLTLDSCIALAKQNNADIVTSRLEIDRAMEVKKQVFTLYFPQVQGAVIGYQGLKHLIGVTPSQVSNPDWREMLQSMLDSYNEEWGANDKDLGIMRTGISARATAVQPIYMGGRIVNGNKLAKVGVEAAKLQAEVSERDVVENIESSYFMVVGLEQKVKTIESALNLLDSIDQTAQVAYSAGVVTKSDILQVALKRNEMLALQQQLMSGIELSKKLLCVQIGIPYDETVVFQDHVFDEPVQSGVGVPSFVRPEVNLLAMNVKAEELRKKLTIGGTLPQIGIGFTYSYGNFFSNGNLFHMLYGKESYKESDQFRNNGVLFVALSVPLSQWWETSHKIKEHNIKIQEAKIKQENLGRMMTIQEEKALSDMTQAKMQLVSDSSALVMAEENYRLAQLNYEAGNNTLNDVLMANSLLLQAQNAITDRWITYTSSKRRVNDLRGTK